MEKSIRIDLIFVVLLLIISSCEFIPKGENFSEVDPNVSPPDVVLDLSFDSDTIFINSYPFTISYSADASYNLVYGIFLMIGQDTLRTDWDNNGQFTFKPSTFYEVGKHNLKMNVITNTETGSLADVTGYELYTFEYQWTLFIEDTN